MTTKKILIVDDCQTELLHLKKILEDAGYQTITANSGDEAIKKIRQERPNLVLLDIVMEGKDGYHTCREIHKEPTTSDLPIVMVTSKTQAADRMWASKQGASGFISKPYTNEQILDQVKVLA
ncbi:PleD family two-component system response regulator [Halioxenophilus sp. WMMB6]|uniref:response regulator n=1 Tax=Halioxenophilus sp. WMMB6 TaxID=3073815 RepID=UPI00295F3F21|nr:response regulator [Halioxenophilus sp. WMMB6]